MCNNWCVGFSEKLIEFKESSLGRVLEVGSRNVNGSIRDVIGKHSNHYVGVDICEGFGVDEIVNVKDLIATFGAESFDVVASTEMIEHCEDWSGAIFQMLSVLRYGGFFLLTTRSPGFELHEYPADYWRFSSEDFQEIFAPVGDIISIESDMTLGWPCGVGILLQKKIVNSQLNYWHDLQKSRAVFSMENHSENSYFLDENNYKMIFDQYSRYRACSDLLKHFGLVRGDSILDVGSGVECLLGKFVLNADIMYVDPLLNDVGDPRKITGTIFTPQLSARSFDFVTAIDIFEHIPSAERLSFLRRVSSLAKSGLVIGFPATESHALQVDSNLNDKFRDFYGHDYSWLEEHCKYGLPSVVEAVDNLEKLGWHCQVVGHGYAPWLEKLLGIFICVLEHPEMKELVFAISEKFNKNLYDSDFRHPHYRFFIVASRYKIENYSIPSASTCADEYFKELIIEFNSAFYMKSLGLICDQKKNLIDIDNKIKKAINDRDEVLMFCNEIQQSKSWRITRPLRFAAGLMRSVFGKLDQRHLLNELRDCYHRLPLPSFVKKTISFSYHHVLKRSLQRISRSLDRSVPFAAPSSQPSPQKDTWDYIVWGVIDWHFRHQRPQQLSLAIAESGRRVFYISPNLIDDTRPGFAMEAIDSAGLIFQINLFAVGSPSIYSSAPSPETVAHIRQSLGEVLDWADSKRVVSLVDHPFWYDIARVVPNSRLVYDCMDHHEGFGNNGDALLRLEQRLIAEADVTITTSSWLENSVAPHAKKVKILRNACDYEHFSCVPAVVHRDPFGRPVIGYYGAIAEWFDLDLLEMVAKSHPECSVMLIGADTVNAKSRLGRLPNVTFTGEVPYGLLPQYLHGFDVCLLPFKIIPLTLATNPVKAYEYLSAGKPVVAVDLPEMSQFDGLIRVAVDHQGFVKAVREAVEAHESGEIVQKRRVFARSQTWGHRAESLTRFSEDITSDPRVSVVVVTYNNLELTKACLASIDSHSQYGNLEVIVVDNASSDGTQSYLAEWVSGESDRKIILNEPNRGFAAANNQGLASATGDYLVLLNNDTYVTPGWIRTLVRHLERDKTIGLIGPVTNNIGNEAKIDIYYDNMDEMLTKSAKYTRRHIGQLYPLRTAAFFCVMMSRTVYERVGGLDESFGRGFFEDDDYCRRIEQAGLRIACAEDVFVHHHLSASFSQIKQQERAALFSANKAIYEAKWGPWRAHSYR